MKGRCLFAAMMCRTTLALQFPDLKEMALKNRKYLPVPTAETGLIYHDDRVLCQTYMGCLSQWMDGWMV